MAWTLDIRDRVGSTLLKSGVAFKSLTAHWVLNGAGSIEVELRHDADIGSALVGQAELQLLRNGTIVWAGPWLGSDVDPRGRRLRMNGEGLWWWFRRRVITSDLLYASTNQHQIAWNLLNHTQGQSFGSLGIIQGTHTGTNKARSRFYCKENVLNVAEEVEAFTQYDVGLDFNINPATRAFDTWSPSRRSSSGISLDGSSVDTLTWTEDMRDVLTYYTGVGDSDCGAVLATATDGTQANTYGRLQEAGDADDEDDTSGEVTEFATEALNSRKRPRFDGTVIFREGGTGAPAFSSLIPGNTLLLSDTRGYSTFTNKLLRIADVGVSLDEGLPNIAVFTLELTSEVGA
jgi:hypothetical protein